MPRRDEPITVDEAIDQLGFGAFQLRLLLLLSVVHTADAIANTIDPFLADHLQCTWGLALNLPILLPYIILVGACIGSIGCGLLADRYGRRTVLLLSCFTGFYFIALSALAQHSFWFLLLRFCQSAAVAGIKGVALAYIAEFLPNECRGKLIVTYQFFWTVGYLVVVLLAYLFLPALNWRPMVLITALPLAAAGIITILLPASPYALVYHGRTEEAAAVLLEIALINKVAPVENALRKLTSIQISDSNSQRTSSGDDSDHLRHSGRGAAGRSAYVGDNERSGWRRRCHLYLFALVFLALWLVMGFITNSSSLVNTHLPLTPHDCLPPFILMTRYARTAISSAAYRRADLTDTSCCHQILEIDFQSQAIEAAHYAIGGALALVCIDALQRRRTMTFSGAFATLLFLPLNFCLPSEARRALLVLTLSCVTALRSALTVYTLETFPTKHRAFGYGLCSALEAIGSMCTPLIVLLAKPNNRVQDAYIFNTVILLASSLLALLLPVETGRLPLAHTVEESVQRVTRPDEELEPPEGMTVYRTFNNARRRRLQS